MTAMFIQQQATINDVTIDYIRTYIDLIMIPVCHIAGNFHDNKILNLFLDFPITYYYFIHANWNIL